MSFVESVTHKNRHLVTELAESQRAVEDLFASNVCLQGAQMALQVGWGEGGKRERGRAPAGGADGAAEAGVLKGETG